MSAILVAVVAMLLVAFGLGLHVATTLGLTAMSLGALFGDRPFGFILGQIPWNVGTSTTLVAIPLFLLMGEILLRSGLTERMYQTLGKWLNNLPGGLLHTNIVACGIFAAISGSSVATAVTIGSVSLPSLRAQGYDESLALGSLAAGGTLGILIPPSIVFIVYGVLVEESIGRLYIAGVVPGLIMMLLFMAVIIVATKLRPGLTPERTVIPWRDRLVSLVHLLPVIGLIFLVLGTIYLGVATPTEAAAFGTAGALVVALINKRVNWRMLRDTFIATGVTTSTLMFILVGAFLLQFVLAFLGLPAAMGRWIISLGLTQLELILMICVLYLVLGMFMESLAMVVTTLPVLLPLLKALHVDLVWFGVIVVILVESALITPPVGMNIFVLQSVRNQVPGGKSDRTIMDLYVGALPFLFAMAATLGLVIAFPETALWLVGTAKGR